MTASHQCPLCGSHLPDGGGSSCPGELLARPLSDSVKWLAFINFVGNHKMRFGDSARLGRIAEGDGLPGPGHFFLRVNEKVTDLFLRDGLFPDGDTGAVIHAEMAGIEKLECLWINSPGGSVCQAVKIRNALRGKTPKCVIHRCCASSAVLIAFAADRILIHPEARMVLHPAQTAVMGNSLDLRKTALELDLATEATLDAVMARTGQPESVVRSWFNPEADKFFTAQEAVGAGLADGYFELPAG